MQSDRKHLLEIKLVRKDNVIIFHLWLVCHTLHYCLSGTHFSFLCTLTTICLSELWFFHVILSREFLGQERRICVNANWELDVSFWAEFPERGFFAVGHFCCSRTNTIHAILISVIKNIPCFWVTGSLSGGKLSGKTSCKLLVRTAKCQYKSNKLRKVIQTVERWLKSLFC